MLWSIVLNFPALPIFFIIAGRNNNVPFDETKSQCLIQPITIVSYTSYIVFFLSFRPTEENLKVFFF